MPDQPIMRTGRTLSQRGPTAPVTLYRIVPGDDRLADEWVGVAFTTEIGQAICEAVNVRGVPLPVSDAAARRLLEEALHLRMNGERAPGGNETWQEWDMRAEAFLRGDRQ